MTNHGPVRIALMCVQNAGRSQMATAFAERERDRRGLDDRVELLSGGTNPADSIHETVIETMQEVGIDISERNPRKITTEELESCDYIVTMGCSTLEVDPATDIDIRDWALEDPHGQDPDAVRGIREQVEQNVSTLFDEITDTAADSSSESDP